MPSPGDTPDRQHTTRDQKSDRKADVVHDNSHTLPRNRSCVLGARHGAPKKQVPGVERPERAASGCDVQGRHGFRRAGTWAGAPHHQDVPRHLPAGLQNLEGAECRVRPR